MCEHAGVCVEEKEEACVVLEETMVRATILSPRELERGLWASGI